MSYLSDPRLYITATFALIALIAFKRSGGNNRNRYSTLGAIRPPEGEARSFDECFPPEPKRVRCGIVAERETEMLVPYSLSTIRQANPVKTLHYVYRIIYHDVRGGEEERIVVEQDNTNTLADVGRFVEVTSQRNRLNHNHTVYSIAAV